MPHRRNILAERLAEFPEVVLGGERVFEHRGRWREVFRERIGTGVDGRLIFEVGCSEGDALCEIAAKHPGTAFVGVDWKVKSLYTAASRVAERGLRNVVLLRGRAQDIGKIFGRGEVDEVWVFHPEPCDKPKELRNRLIAEPFLRDVHGVLRGAVARLCLKTDHPGYYQWTLALLGLPEPAWGPRVKVRDLMRREDLQPRSDAIGERFDVALTSADFWNDPAALAHTGTHAFTGVVTPFERRFLAKRLPIYYVELSPKRT
jgi:tRNA (guanine-N7-)-methyltransferase